LRFHACPPILRRTDTDAEAALNEHLRVSIDHLLEGVQVVGFDWRYLYVNAAAAAHGQTSADQLVGRTMMECYPGIEHSEMFLVLQRVMSTRRPAALRHEFTRHTGGSQWFDLRVDPVPGGICVLSFDVTDQQLVLDRLREQDARMRLALEVAAIAVWQLDLRSERMMWSGALQDVLGTPTLPETLDAFLEHVDPPQRDALRTTLTAAARSSRPDFDVSFTVQRDDGQRRLLEGHGRVVRNARGEPDGVIGVVTDGTERRSTEMQLQQAQKMDAIGRLAGGIAHDFNNQLTAILGFTELILEQNPGETLTRDLNEIRSAAERSAALTAQLLAFGRKQMLSNEAVDVNGTVGGVARMLARVLPEDVSCEVRLEPGVPAIRADAGQLEHVLTNLAVNARDAMPAGGRLVLGTGTVTFSAEDIRHHVPMTAGRYAMMFVSDSGHGMDDATKARIFEPFFTTKAPGKGTGLGLAMVYGVVKQMGGFIWVYSEPGRGTTFRLYFPALAEEEARPAGAGATTPDARGNANGRGELVFVIEDDGGVRDLTVRTLRAHNYRVIEATSAEDARAKLSATPGPVDLFLVDVVLTGQSGPDLMDQLRAGARVLFMSGYSEAHVEHRGWTSRDHLLEKPFTIQGLLETVRAALDVRPS
jgi:two-component system cell cycle sensor histidine kinase/response regulator CckA